MTNTTVAPVLVSAVVTPDTLIISQQHENRSYVTDISTSQHPLSFILVPVVVILCVAFFSGAAIYCIQRRKRLDNLRHTLIPLYTFTKDEEEEWGVLLDHYSNHDLNSDQNEKTEDREFR